MAFGLKFRSELSRLGRALVEEFDNVSAYLNNAGLVSAANLYYASAIATTTQAVTTATTTRVSLVADEDPSGLVVNSGIRAPINGWYSGYGIIQWASGAGNLRVGSFYVDGTRKMFHSCPPVAGDVTTNLIPFELRLVVGNLVQLYGYQDSGGNLNCGSLDPTRTNRLFLRWVRP